MVKRIITIIGIVIVADFVLFLIRGSEDTWICVNGDWIEHGMPSAEKPVEPCS